MIFGREQKEQDAMDQLKVIEMINGVEKFAVIPIRLHNGRWIWWQPFFAYYHGGVNDDGTYFLWNRSREDYSPYFRASETRDPSLISLSEPK